MRRSWSFLVLVFAAILVSPSFAATPHRRALAQAPAKETARINPYAGQQTAVQAGAKLFRRECAACHGAEAEGTPRAPALAAPTVRNAPPGAVFWVLRNGSLWHGMPSFAHLSEAQRWQIVTYLKTL